MSGKNATGCPTPEKMILNQAIRGIRGDGSLIMNFEPNDIALIALLELGLQAWKQGDRSLFRKQFGSAADSYLEEVVRLCEATKKEERKEEVKSG